MSTGPGGYQFPDERATPPDSSNPYADLFGPSGTPASPPPVSRLQSLASSARAANVKQGRTALIIAGVVITIEALVGFFVVESEIDKAINKEVQQVRAQGMMVDNARVQQVRDAAVRAGRLIMFGIGALAVVFFVLAAIVQKFPLGAALIGLILYIGFYAVVAAMSDNPIQVIVGGWLWKAIVIIGLVKAIQAGAAANAAPAPAA